MQRRTEAIIVGPVLLVGLALRLEQASTTYLNPDEILHFFVSLPSTFKGLMLNLGLRADHPPLLFLLLHPVASVTRSELALRLIPVLAGSIFPWAAYRWLARAWNANAGIAALVLLTLNPNLIALSAQIRGYTLELLFAALALLFLESALDQDSVRSMVLVGACLDLTILSEYSAAFFAAAAGVYFLLRAWQSQVSRRLWTVWAGSQMTALAIYAALYPIMIRPRLADAGGNIDGYLRGAFPAAHQSLLVFSVLATMKQFAYAFSSIEAGIAGVVLFAIGLLIVWRTRRAMAILLVVPFLFACIAALLRLHPYGRSRHTVILSLFIAAGAGVSLERLLRSRPRIAAASAVALGLFWLFASEPDQNNIARSRDRRASLIAGIDYMKRTIPPGSLVLADLESLRYLRFYADTSALAPGDDFDSPTGPPIDSFRVTWRRWDFGDVDNLPADLASVRSQFDENPDSAVWIVDGGFDNGIDVRLRRRFPGVVLPAFRDFDGAIAVFQAPPGMPR